MLDNSAVLGFYTDIALLVLVLGLIAWFLVVYGARLGKLLKRYWMWVVGAVVGGLLIARWFFRKPETATPPTQGIKALSAITDTRIAATEAQLDDAKAEIEAILTQAQKAQQELPFVPDASGTPAVQRNPQLDAFVKRISHRGPE